MDKWKKIDEDEKRLVAQGYQQKTFFYATGGGEDENDVQVFIRDGIAYYHLNAVWYKARWELFEYRHGLPAGEPTSIPE